MFDTLTRMGASASGAYEIERSLRFDKTDDQNLQFTPSSDGNRRTWTFSCWLKRSVVGGGSQAFFRCREGSYPKGLVMARFLSDKLDILRWNGASAAWQVQTNRLFRDPASWYHIVIAYDTTQGTAANRVKLYVNGTQETDLGEDDYPNQNSDYEINTQFPHEVGVASFDGYMADVYFIDGQALTPSSFGETNEDTGQWRPIKYAGTYGTNGFFLEFKDNSAATAAAIGKDTSGNGHNFTPSDISVATTFEGDSMPDTPTNNMCIVNSAYNPEGGDPTIDQGGLFVETGGSDGGALSTIGIPQSGKWFFEVKMTALNSEGSSTGWIGIGSSQAHSTSPSQPRVIYYGYTGDKWIEDTGTSYGDSYGLNDVIGCAVNMDDDEITFYKNGTSQGAITSWRVTGNQYFFYVSDGGSAGSTDYQINFGQKDFLHSKPAGYKILTANNLPEPTILKGSDYFNPMLYTGTGAEHAITGLGFSPDLVWTKGRSDDDNNSIFDTVRGANAELVVNSDGVEATGDVQLVKSFDSDGFTLGTNAGVNGNNETYVAWCWKESATAGFDIVSYTGNGSNRTISHSLGVKPSGMLVRHRGAAGNHWVYWHDVEMDGTNFLYWDTTAAEMSHGPIWNSTEPTSSVFSVGTDNQTNQNGINFIAYLWADVPGYSKFGSYLGNGSDDGTFVYTGFRPAYVWYKRIDTSGKPWYVNDSKRSPHNVVHNTLVTSTDATEQTNSNNTIDFLSNGWKVRKGATSTLNTDGGTFIYIAFAERPFKYANAR